MRGKDVHAGCGDDRQIGSRLNAYHLAHVTKTSKPRCIVIAGPNGAGKTTFARRYLSNEVGIVHFINADLIAAGLAPLAPFESTLSGRGYAERLKRLKRRGYRVEIIFLRVATPQLALRRIAARVRQGGHDVQKADVLRRFDRGWRNFLSSLADNWVVYENSGRIAKPVEHGPIKDA